MKTFNIEGKDKIILWQLIEDYGFGYAFQRYKRHFDNKEHFIKYAKERCRPYWEHAHFKDGTPTEEKIRDGHNFNLNGKQESYWKNENEMIYLPPPFNQLSFEEKRLMLKEIAKDVESICESEFGHKVEAQINMSHKSQIKLKTRGNYETTDAHKLITALHCVESCSVVYNGECSTIIFVDLN